MLKRSIPLLLALCWSQAALALEPVDRFMAAYMARWQVESARIAVLRDGHVVYARGYGNAKSADEPMLLGSLTKALTAASVLALVEDGRLRLEDRLREIPGLLAGLGTPADARLLDVTVRQLLTHTAGLPINDTRDPIRQKVSAKDPSAARNAVLREALKRPLAFGPGNGFAYSNTGYLMLGRIIETLSGRPYLAFLKDSVLADAPEVWIDSEWPQLEAAGGVRLSPTSYARFFESASGRLGADLITPPGAADLEVGYGVMRRGGDTFHFGSWNQNRTLALIRSDGMGAVVAFGKRLNAAEPTRDLDASLRGALDEVLALAP
jgi:CubicO group peptidase (beta-lactamase class C family)